MNINFVANQAATGESNARNECSPQRFVVFVAGGKRPIISFETFARAERLAVFFADLTNVRMEVFDSMKEICYFVCPCADSQCACSINSAI